ncbi:PhoD-like phosphatase [Desertifilum sp. FACHB-1129]|uniref:PhoD-like phosphatase n=1 Tax=Desertifilum tharense IPPAS B-1220 TaxID=1781255 RepID=A0A1E5QGD8_9CYAN|nr:MULTISPECIES: hypothetical protein [Desertifilum]MDA0209305.1 PhoD-like phosphatase [Cyanobacteria bacterium FC1]MBD2314928.1 PhoD-like phosphatase [Desertifilum sp. FACHB-1129]MBD2325149.1 PhoD-like phosphatase [Desertifilum sp. FACHB-866]MBD2332709.1 PhoD-like phosphatase [Desertifilum sp. FACHB-868]OEJ73678.1 hypothetical protein BH720_18375 [Desertifilum tharense IPPAS B-1220]
MQPLSQRLSHLPLILAGPILRRTESQAVTVWVALKQPRTVTLKVYATVEEGSQIDRPLLSGTQPTVKVGEFLHLVAVTATPLHHSALLPGQLYAYNLFFDGETEDLATALSGSADRFDVPISYFSHNLPTFALPAANLDDLRILHGSCRKMHGGDRDAAAIIDDLIARQAQYPNNRPQQLFFTGDQIYGDDVADAMLAVLTEAGDTLLGWQEQLPVQQADSNLKPGQRCETAKLEAGLTAMLVNKEHLAKSHLFSLGEYLTIYLFAWSPVLWPDTFADGETVYPNDRKQSKRWNQEVQDLLSFRAELHKVRRALANIPTYTIFDDHDVTDDWYLNRWWCQSVLSKPLGRCVIFNGLLAYALFQAWGNTPDRFIEGEAGGELLDAVQLWSASQGTDRAAYQILAQRLGLPLQHPETGQPEFWQDDQVWVLQRHHRVLQWHYTLRGPKHEVLLLDTRTYRGYPVGENREIDPPMLLSPTAFKTQIAEPLEETDRLVQAGESEIELTLVILPTNVVSLRAIDWAQRSDLERGRVFHSDVGDSWNFHQAALSQLLSELFQRRDRIIALSGDIHYSCAVRLSYWFTRHFGTPKPPLALEQSRLLVQLTSSAIDNVEWRARVAHSRLKSLLPEPVEEWVGWNEPPNLVEIQVNGDRIRRFTLPASPTGPILRQVKGVQGDPTLAWRVFPQDSKQLPDWRYRIEWIPRQRATLLADEKAQLLLRTPLSPPPTSLKEQLVNGVLLVWRNPWMQEGREVVACNNISLVSFQGFDSPQTPLSEQNQLAQAVIQDTYWRTPWQPTSIVSSRYWVPLTREEPPPARY